MSKEKGEYYLSSRVEVLAFQVKHLKEEKVMMLKQITDLVKKNKVAMDELRVALSKMNPEPKEVEVVKD